jgi:hypothetical protein
MRKYLTVGGPRLAREVGKRAEQARLLTIINLLQSYLSIVRECLLSLSAQHKCLWFLRSCHGCMLRRIHGILSAAATGRVGRFSQAVVCEDQGRKKLTSSSYFEALPLERLVFSFDVFFACSF